MSLESTIAEPFAGYLIEFVVTALEPLDADQALRGSQHLTPEGSQGTRNSRSDMILFDPVPHCTSLYTPGAIVSP